MRKLCTIGYEGADIDDFLQTLIDANIHVLIDVRELPMSRRKGFSKTALKASLANAGIDYQHERQLGSPRDIRRQLREDWNYTRFFLDYDKHLSQHTGLLQKLSKDLRGNVALMCYEKDHSQCHRASVVDALAALANKTPIHL